MGALGGVLCHAHSWRWNPTAVRGCEDVSGYKGNRGLSLLRDEWLFSVARLRSVTLAELNILDTVAELPVYLTKQRTAYQNMSSNGETC